MAYYWTESGAAQYGTSRDGSVNTQLFNPKESRISLQQAIDQGLIYQRDATQAAAAEQSEEAAELAASQRDRLIRGQVRQAFAASDNVSFVAQAFGSGRRDQNLGGVSGMVAQFMGQQ